MSSPAAPDNQDFEHVPVASWLPSAPHAISAEVVVEQLDSTTQGITSEEAQARLQQYGPNRLPRSEPPSLLKIFLCQFVSPLIYVLVAAAIFSLVIQEWSDAAFITGVLLINAIIGTIQEFSAQRAATALQQLVTTRSRVLRDGDALEINAENLVPGDILPQSFHLTRAAEYRQAPGFLHLFQAHLHRAIRDYAS